ncbi:hypothetical protein IZY60_10125 [Lutibacter sp. B2]|nr:hypothetical protein [Lutibacter sp. B2]
MEQYVLVKIFMFSTLENIVILSMAHGFLGKKINWIKWIFISMIIAIVLHFIRISSDNYILYSVISTCIFIVGLITIKAVGLFYAIIVIFLSEAIYNMIEFLTIKMLIIIFKINPLNFAHDLFLAIYCFIPQILLAFGISYMISYYNFSIFNDNR